MKGLKVIWYTGGNSRCRENSLKRHEVFGVKITKSLKSVSWFVALRL